VNVSHLKTRRTWRGSRAGIDGTARPGRRVVTMLPCFARR